MPKFRDLILVVVILSTLFIDLPIIAFLAIFAGLLLVIDMTSSAFDLMSAL